MVCQPIIFWTRAPYVEMDPYCPDLPNPFPEKTKILLTPLGPSENLT